jgi:hypothetical protein
MTTKRKYEIIPMRDKSDAYTIKKDLIFDLPMRIGIVGKSQLSGKTTILGNLLCFKDFYFNDFKGKNIYIVSPSIKTEKYKMIIKYNKIPDDNLFKEYDDELLQELYLLLQDEYDEAIDDKIKPDQKIIIFDDIGWDGSLKKKQFGIVDKLFCNGRHFNISTVCLVQKYTQLSCTIRENLTGLIVFASSYAQLEHIINEHNTSSKKKFFIKAFQNATKERHSFFVVNYTNPIGSRYIKNFTDVIKIDD